MLADDPASKAPLTLAGEAGRGHYLIDALPLEPAHYELYQYQPFLLEGITQTGGLQPVLAGSDLGVYVDYGYHDDEQPGGAGRAAAAVGHPPDLLQRLV